MRRRRTAHRFGEKRRTADVLIDEKVDFSGLMLSSDVLDGLKSAGFERPSPIQLKAIPLGRCGLDLIAQAKSGTGKTCVFSVIALENINVAVTAIQVLVLAPTREIAVQIKDVMCSIGRHLKGLQTHVFIGGMPLEDDKNRLKQCHIAIGSPGRIKHLIESKLLQTTSIRLFILDEADKLLDQSFQEQINWIYSTLPVSKQMLALSATYPDHLAERLKNYMKDPTFVRLNAADPALEGIRHYRCVVPSHSLPHKVFHEKVQSLLQLFSKLSFHQCLIFSNYQIRARNLSETLAKNGWPSTYISGGQAQNERLNAMAKLKEFKCRILISTDLTSRGIDAERVNLVINMDLPRESETYLHRVGRAGRFGSYGVAVNFVAEGQDVASLDEIAANCGVAIMPLPDDVSKLLSEEIMMESKQVRSTRQEGNNVLDKNIEIEHLEMENVLENPEREKDIQKEVIPANGETAIECQQTIDKMEANKEIVTELQGTGNIIKNTEGRGIGSENGIKTENQEKESLVANGEGDKNIKQEVIDAESQCTEIQAQQGKSLMEETNQQESDIERVKIAAQETTVDELQETGFFRHKATDKVVQIKNDNDGNKTENGEEASVISQRAYVTVEELGIEFQNTESKMKDTKEENDLRQEVSLIDDEGNDKCRESDKKLEDTKVAGKTLQAGAVAGRNLNKIEDLNTGDKILNTDNEANILPRNIVSVESKKYGDVQEDAEKFDMSDLSNELEIERERRRNVADNDVKKDSVATGNDSVATGNDKSKILFRYRDANMFPEADELSSDDSGSDCSESEFSSPDETGPSDESRDNHVPMSCKDFDNVFEAYLSRSADGFSTNDKQHQETDFHASLKLGIHKNANYDEMAGASSNAIHANEVRPLPNGAQGNAIYANEASEDFVAVEPDNGQKSEETMFYGATPDDVTAYMAELPAQWKNTWYRVYEKQTAFIVKYTKFCHENF